MLLAKKFYAGVFNKLAEKRHNGRQLAAVFQLTTPAISAPPPPPLISTHIKHQTPNIVWLARRRARSARSKRCAAAIGGTENDRRQ
eukprot:4827353-Prymnesium_polylepis.2